MEEEVLGSGFSQKVRDQFDAREEILSEKNRQDRNLLYLNSNSTWVRLSSSINTLSDEEIKKLKNNKNLMTITGSNVLANNNRLGTEKLLGGISTEAGFEPSKQKSIGSQIEAGDIRTNAYHNFDSRGFRPKPGITGVDIKSKNTYGTLREAEISLKVWSVEDLELIQALYLRPGYSMLLEWGHSLWIDPENSNELSRINYMYDKFTQDKLKQSEIYESLDKLRKKSSHNYDAMFGYVVNFNWDFRNDGGYDCKVKLVSRGAILESMGFTFDPTARLKQTEFRNKTREKGKQERISVYHKFAEECKAAKAEKNKFGTMKSFSRDTLHEKYALEFRSKLKPFYGFNFHIELKDTGFFDNDDVLGVYVPLYTILDIYNNFLAPIDNTKSEEKDRNILRFYTGQTDKEGERKYTKKNKYLTSEYHFSADPLVCVLPKRPVEGTYELTDGKKKKILGEVTKGVDFQRKLESILAFDEIKGESDDILNIYIPMYTVLEKINAIVDSSAKPSQGFLKLLQDLLEEINDALGGVNELGIHYEESENMYYIIDRKLTPTKKSKLYTMNLTGLKSSVENLNVSSKISSNIASMVSIAAQGTSGNYKEGVEALMKWNSGLVDRHIPNRSTTETNTSVDESEDKTEEERLEEFINMVEDIFQEFNSFDSDYNQEGFLNIKAYHKEFTTKYVQKQYSNNEGEKKSVPGLIPIELSFSTIGIGGLKIGQAFNIADGILPRKYTKDFGFIITGLDQKIDNGKWKTIIKTQFYPTSQSEEDSKVVPIEKGTDTPKSQPPLEVEQDNQEKLRQVTQNLATSQTGIELIKSFEGFSSETYLDQAGVLTIGYGFTSAGLERELNENETMPVEQANRLLKEIVRGIETQVKRLIEVPLSQGEFDALVSFTYNLGAGTLQDSTLRRVLNQGEYTQAANEITRFIKVGGKIISGLVRRRKAEQNLFLT